MGEAGPYRVVSYDKLGSTNDEAMARLRAGDPGDLIIVAREQTGGRGRQGRVWTSPPGNLHASLALVDPAPAHLAPQLGFVAGVALASALRTRLAGDERLKIKWPNDAVFDGAKIAGILLECTSLPGDRIGCVIGIGVNCLAHPDGLPYPATDLFAAGDPAPAPATVLRVLTQALAEQIEIWDRGAGFAAVRSKWLAMAAGVGQRIVVRTASDQIAGVFERLDSMGRLVIATDTGDFEIIDAGDVFLPGVQAMALQ